MTTDRAPNRQRMRVIEWRLYVVAVLAAIYALVWRALDRPAAVAGEPVGQTAAPPAAAVWLDELPAAQRPAITAPAGWEVIDRHATSSPSAPIARRPLVRAPASRPRRVRTRSS